MTDLLPVYNSSNLSNVPNAERLDGLDRIRGLAIAGMIASHVLATFPSGGGNAIRLTALRFIAPVFVVVAGSLLANRNASSRAFVRIAAGIVGTYLVTIPLGEMPMILPQFLALLAVWPAVRRYPSSAAFIACTWAMNAAVFPVPSSFYQPAAMVLAMLLGAQVGRARVSAIGDALPRSFGVIGRYPLTFYVGHLAVLGALVASGIGHAWAT